MKRLITLLPVYLFVLVVCGGCQESDTPNNGLITVDITQNYPKKELILQDFMDVEYIPLESSDEFVTIGWLHDVGKDAIIVRDRSRFVANGDIYIFDRKGKALRKINRKGEGEEEYLYLFGITLDEKNNELFVNDHWRGRVLVYDLLGNYKRNFKHSEGRQYDMAMYNFDNDHLLCSAVDAEKFEKANIYQVVSKQDGSVVKEIDIPYEKSISPIAFSRDSILLMPIRNRTFVPAGNNGWMIMECSTDTIYQLQSDFSKTPLVVRTPSIQTMALPKVFLYPAVLTDRYLFMQTVEAKWDFGSRRGHKRVDLVYDRKKNAIFEYTLRNADIENGVPLTIVSEITHGDNEIACVHKLEVYDLLEAYNKGQLKGKLKEIASKLDEDSNPVLMFMKYKK